MLAVLSILFLITACGDKPGDNPVAPSAPEKPSEGGGTIQNIKTKN